MLRALIVLTLMGSTAAMAADELQDRLELTPEVLEELLQPERWALMDAQKFGAKGEHQRAAVEFEKFTTTFPDSVAWAYATYSGCWHLMQDRRYEAASERLRELIDLGEGLSEIPEATLLLGRCRLAAGDAAEALGILRELLDAHGDSPAAIPARVLASRALAESARAKGQAVEDVAVARIRLLAPLTTDIVVDDRNGGELLDGIDQLASLALRADDTKQLLALLRGLATAKETSRHHRLSSRREDLARKTMALALDHGRDAVAGEVAAILWADPGPRTLGLAEGYLAWSGEALREPGAVAAQRGVSEDELRAGIQQRQSELATQVEQALTAAADDLRRDLGQVLARLRLRTGGSWAEAEAALDQGFEGHWDERRAYDAFRFALHAGVPAAAAAGVAARVDDPDQRAATELRILEHRGRHLDDADAARRAIALCTTNAQQGGGDGRGYLYRAAELYRDPLRDWDAAISTYEAIDQPPRTDLAIAECLGHKGDWKGAFGRYGAVHALSPGDRTGAQALLRMGRIANERLDDRVRAIQLLRQVCDDYPDTREYSDAHVYLQNELKVTYTGGGGGQKAKR